MNRCNFCGRLFKRKLHNSNIFEQLICPKCAKEIIKSHITLGIGILHYKESEDLMLKSLLSIDNQINFDFNQLEVIVVTDGGGSLINEKYVSSKLKHIQPKYVYRTENGKCGGTRNTIIESLTTDYVMFLDSDDKLASRKVLSRIYKRINKYKPDIYCSAVLEEQYDGSFKKYTNLMCLNMCHGKAFKKSAILNYNIWQDPTIPVGEDLVWLTSLYNVCDNIYYDSNFATYKWLFNKASITRNIGVDYELDSYYRCFDYVMKQLNDWYKNINSNKFVNDKFITMMYNIFYYRIKLTTSGDVQKEYLYKFFNYVKEKVDFDLSDQLDKSLNRKLLKKITYFKDAYNEYKGEMKCL